MQISPEIASGSGVGGVAYHLEQAWQQLGVPTERFTLDDAGGGWLPEPGRGARGKLVLAGRVVWFSLIGTWLARRRYASRPDLVVICHNDVLFGDVYVNHGVLAAAMRARGHLVLRMLRNPLHLFTVLRDAARYRSRVHRVVVSLTTREAGLLRATYGAVRAEIAVIGNGVDVARFRPSSRIERQQARQHYDVPDDSLVLLFVGHEFDRKGLPIAIEALNGTAEHLQLLVVGGTVDMIAQARQWAQRQRVADRVRFVGRLDDPRPAFAAADSLVLPSAYEASALVVLESLAAGLPVLTTDVGAAGELICDGLNGYIVERTADSVRGAYQRLADSDLDGLAAAARQTAIKHSWSTVGQRYLELFDALPGGAHPNGQVQA